MVTASFLVKDLGIDWREGARHFFDLLLDGDVAQNIGNWQWVAGTGVDTRPNRIYNPTAQLKKLDPEGAYVRRYVPELADVPARDIAEPGLLAPSYPRPIVDHAQAVAAFRKRRGVGRMTSLEAMSADQERRERAARSAASPTHTSGRDPATPTMPCAGSQARSRATSSISAPARAS